MVRRVKYRFMVDGFVSEVSPAVLSSDLRYGDNKSYRESAILHE